MRKIPIYQLDAFADRLFAGNPAAVCPLDDWLPDDVMQSIGAENNLAETAFIVGGNGSYDIRWFTPAVEVDLCGHATLAAGHVVMNHLERGRDDVGFGSRSGRLLVARRGDRLELDFPARSADAHDAPTELLRGLGSVPGEVYLCADDYLTLFADEAAVAALKPDFSMLARLANRGVMATAPGTTVDFVSRFFAPAVGIDEDPVTGSAHCALAPFWAQRLGKTTLQARQISKRGGNIECEVRGDRVLLRGRVVEYLRGEIAA